jgi:hypothetical protein
LHVGLEFPLLPDERVDIVFFVTIILCVIKFI